MFRIEIVHDSTATTPYESVIMLLSKRGYCLIVHMGAFN